MEVAHNSVSAHSDDLRYRHMRRCPSHVNEYVLSYFELALESACFASFSACICALACLYRSVSECAYAPLQMMRACECVRAFVRACACACVSVRA
eukprot:5532921-Pleurochrysis_carterae.AAC.2